MQARGNESAKAVIERLLAAINAHDLEGFLACFDRDYRSEQPWHPERSFTGVERVRENWGHNLAAMSDLRWEPFRLTAEDDRVALEVRWSGTRAAGERWIHQGVIVYTVSDGRVVAGTLYMDTVA